MPPLETWTPSAEERLVGRSTREMVRACIGRLPAAYRAVLLLRGIEELDTREVAEILSLTQNAVKIRLHRARQALRTLIARGLHAGAGATLTPGAAAHDMRSPRIRRSVERRV